MALLSTDSIDWKVDATTGDLVSPMVYNTGLDAVAQGIRIRVQVFKGEWFLNLDQGVPYLPSPTVENSEALLGGKFNAQYARNVFRDAIANAPDVIEIVSLVVEFDGATRVMSVSWTVRTTFGDFSDTLEVF